MTPVIEVKNLSVMISGNLILDDVSFEVEKGDFFAIIGPNGAGKTTLIRAVLGLLPATGEIKVFEEALSTINRKRIGYVPQYQEFDFQFPITVREMVLTGRLGRKSLFSRYSSVDYEAASSALERMSSLSLSGRPVSDLSGGQRQRVLIARALAGEPDILILDEPAVYVDTPTEQQFYELLAALSHEITVLMITHDIGVISNQVTRIACLNKQMFVHDNALLTEEMISKTYGCPVELITHGHVPHRVLCCHEEEK